MKRPGLFLVAAPSVSVEAKQPQAKIAKVFSGEQWEERVFHRCLGQFEEAFQKVRDGKGQSVLGWWKGQIPKTPKAF